MSRLRPLTLALLLGLPPAAGGLAGASGSFERADRMTSGAVQGPEAVDAAGAPVDPGLVEPGDADGEEVEAPPAVTTRPAEAAPAHPFAGEAGRAVRRRAPPLDATNPLPLEQSLMRRARLGESGMLEVATPEGLRALTVDPVLQRQLTHVMASYRTPHAAAVVLDPATGRVLAMAQHAQDAPEDHGLAVRAAYPAASIFKIITASALVRHGLGPSTQECYDGGLRRISKRELLAPGSRCASLASAMGQSTNVIFGKLTHQHLTAKALREEAERFGFNRSIPFEIPVETSEANIPETPFALAETGAGFGDVYLSPLHGALIAATIANGGEWKDPRLFEDLPPLPGGIDQDPLPLENRLTVERVAAVGSPEPEEGGVGAEGTGKAAEQLPGAEATGKAAGQPPGAEVTSTAVAAVQAFAEAPPDAVLPEADEALRASLGTAWLLGEAPTSVPEPAAEEALRVLEPEQAAALAEMLEATVTQGTARRIFSERGYRVEGAVGKTGTLADRRPFRDYSWFIGYAPKDNPRVAIAVVVVNDPIWHIRATWLGREAMRLALARLEGEVAHVVSAAPVPVPVIKPEPLP